MATAPAFSNLTPLQPLTTDVNALLSLLVTNWQNNWYSNTGQNITLVQSDPVYQMLQTQAAQQALLNGMFNTAYNNGTLPFASGEFLDVLGAMFGLVRSQQAFAVVTLQFSLSLAISTNATVPAGTLVSVAGNSALSFATQNDLTIPAGSISGLVPATCTIAGSIGNGLLEGQINTIVNWTQPFIVGVVNIETSAGGADVQSDNSFQSAVFFQSETYTSCGSYGSYQQVAINTDPQAFQDATAVGPESGIVTPGQVWLTMLGVGGTIPNEAQLTDVFNNVTAVNPLTDQVFVNPPEVITFGINMQVWLDTASTTPVTTAIANIDSAVQTAAYNQYQKLGRSIDPTVYIGVAYNAGASRVNMISPAAGSYTPVNPWQVAVPTGNITITYIGSENDYLVSNVGIT
jgi:phage-related baseplate assembly protein